MEPEWSLPFSQELACSGVLFKIVVLSFKCNLHFEMFSIYIRSMKFFTAPFYYSIGSFIALKVKNLSNLRFSESTDILITAEPRSSAL
jgi:hypothetical protein